MSERPRRSAASKLVDIAQELYIFGYIGTDRTDTRGERPEPYTWAAPRFDPAARRPLVEIRGDLAAEYALRHAATPNATALGDAMTTLEGLARRGQRLDPSDPAADELTTAAAAKTSIATVLVGLARDRYRLGVTMAGDTFAVPVTGPNIARSLRGGGRRSLRAELARLYFATVHQAANAAALADALLVLEGDAQDLDPVEVALRVGRDDDGYLVLDLGGDDGICAIIGPAGWYLSAATTLLRRRTNATLPLPTPTSGGSLDELRALLNVRDDDWPLVVAWLVAALIGDIPHPVLLLRGEHGTAKSSAARLLVSLVDPCASQLRTAPRDVEDWCVAAAGSWITCLDNVSDIQPWLSDAICRAVTGDGLLRRQLYTDSDVTVLAYRRVVAITSVDPGRLAGDLADRLLTLDLERIPEEHRRGEQEMTTAWRDVHPIALGGLLDLTARVLAVLPAQRRRGLPRMADFARVLLAVDEVLGSDGYARYAEQASRTAEHLIEGDSVALAIRDRIGGPWEGTAGELLTTLAVDKPPRDWPTTPQGMGARLVRAAPTLRAVGWTVDQLPRTRSARKWYVEPPAAQGVPADMSHPSRTSPTLPDLGVYGDIDGDDPGSA